MEENPFEAEFNAEYDDAEEPEEDDDELGFIRLLQTPQTMSSGHSYDVCQNGIFGELHGSCSCVFNVSLFSKGFRPLALL